MEILQHHTTLKKRRQKCTSKLPSSVVDFSMQQSNGEHNPQLYHQTHGQTRIISWFPTWLQETETQLILSIDDLAKSLDVGEQVDCILVKFSKAFDKVPHSRLLVKLQHYGVRGHLHDWITSFLFEHTQYVVLDGQS
jgi:hypothetical protein